MIFPEFRRFQNYSLPQNLPNEQIESVSSAFVSPVFSGRGRLDELKVLSFTLEGEAKDPVTVISVLAPGIPEGRPYLNIYPDTNTLLFTNTHGFFENHGFTDGLAREALLHPNSSLSPELLSVDEMGFVSGWLDGRDVYLRIDGPKLTVRKGEESLSNEERFERTKSYAEKFQRSFLLGEKLAQFLGGEVVIETTGDPAYVRTAKLLGIIHAMKPLSRFSLVQAEGEVKKAEECSFHVPHFYVRKSGRRFVSPKQFRSLSGLVPNRSVLLEALDFLTENMSETKVSATARVRELVFLTYHEELSVWCPKSYQDVLYALLTETKEKLTLIAPKDWQRNVFRIRQSMEALFQKHEEFCPDWLIEDDLYAPKQVRKLARFFRGSEETSSREELGFGVSTPLDARELGYFPLDQLGVEREFVHFTDDRELSAMASYLQDQFRSQGACLDYICLWEPQIPLTREVRSYRFIERYSCRTPKEDYSKIFNLGGVMPEPFEKTVVIRRHPFSRRYWQSVKDEGARLGRREYYNDFTALELKNLTDAFLESQSILFNQLTKRLPEGDSFSLPPFQSLELPLDTGYEDYQYRPFIYGDRLDLDHWVTLSKERLLHRAEKMAGLMALNLCARRPVFPMHEILSTNSSKKPQDERLVSIGISDSFSNLIEPASIDEVLDQEAVLYGAHLSALLQVVEYGKNQFGVTPEERQKLSLQLVSRFVHGFETAFHSLSGELELSGVFFAYEKRGILLETAPEPFQIHKSLTGIRELMACSPERISERIVSRAYEFLSYSLEGLEWGQVLTDPNEILDANELLISSLRSLIGNHYSTAIEERVRNLLSAEYGLSELPPNVRLHILNFSNVVFSVFPFGDEKVQRFYSLFAEEAIAERVPERMECEIPLLSLDRDVTLEAHESYHALRLAMHQVGDIKSLRTAVIVRRCLKILGDSTF